jgi:hypothetical protein
MATHPHSVLRERGRASPESDRVRAFDPDALSRASPPSVGTISASQPLVAFAAVHVDPQQL